MNLSRRAFAQKTSLAAAGVALFQIGTWGKTSPNGKLNIGVVGLGGQGTANLNGVAGEHVVALCDVDEGVLAKAKQRFPRAASYVDARRMFDLKELDAVVISTADHTHAVCAAPALRRGLHVYCEKPLTRTVSECRVLTELARKNRCVTQLGTQIHAMDNYRRVVELIQTGAIGKVAEVHVWVPGSMGNKELPKTYPPVPSTLAYDLWLGPVEYRPYHPEWVPFNWRHWWAFAGGTLADLGCHHIDLPFWALKLKHPLTVEAEGPPVHPESAPHYLTVRYTFPARGELPPVQLTWYHGGKRPPYFSRGGMPEWGGGTLFVGEKGMLLADYNRHLLWPQKDFQNFVRPEPFIPPSLGHHQEWIHAIKTGGTTTCNFDYSGPLTETVLLGNVAFRTGQKLEWNPGRLKAVNCSEADAFLQHRYRKGWTL